MSRFTECLSPASFVRPKVLTVTSAFGHAPFFFWACEQLRPRSVVELGSAHGYSFFVFCQALELFCPGGECAAVDTWKGDINTGAYSGHVYESVKENLERHFPDARARLLRMTFDEAAGQFADGSLDLVFVDGCHTLEAVRHDFETWLPKMSERGVMLFHDTRVMAENFGVWQFWAEVSGKFPSFEFPHDYGLGVLCVGPKAPKPLLELCSLDEKTTRAIREVYAELGRRLTLEWENHRVARERDLARAQLASQQASLCWKITAPLRLLDRLLRRN